MIRPLSSRNRRILAPFLGTLLLFMLLMLASFNSGVEFEPPHEITLHEIQLYSEPPDPPPAPMKQQGEPGSPLPSLELAKVENHVDLGVLNIDVMDLEGDIVPGGMEGSGSGGMGGFGIGGTGDGYGTGGGWGIVGLSELDRIPIVRSAGTMSYPKEALDSNVEEFKIVVHIIIDEKGRAYPVRIIQNPFPSMNNDLVKWVSGVRFTPPVKLGVPVKTEYAWPLLFKKPLD